MRAGGSWQPMLHELLRRAIESDTEDGFRRACAAVFGEKKMDARQIECVLTSGGAPHRVAALVWVLRAKCAVPTEPPRTESALSIAVRTNALMAAGVLLHRCNATFNARYDPPETLTLHSVARRNQTPMLELLGKHAARLRRQLRLERACYADGLTALHYAVLKKNLGAVRVLVREFLVRRDARDHFDKRPIDYLPSPESCEPNTRFVVSEIHGLLS